MTRSSVLLAAVALTACGGGLSIKTDYDPAAVSAMQSYKTYSWAVSKKDQSVSQMAVQRIHAAVEAALNAKGLHKVESGADVLVAFMATTAQQTDYSTSSSYYGYGWGTWYGSGGMTSSHTTAYNWTQGTLVIDLVDAKSNQLVYRSTGEAEVDKDLSPAERQTRVNDAAVQMLAEFPPKK